MTRVYVTSYFVVLWFTDRLLDIISSNNDSNNRNDNDNAADSNTT